MRPPSLGFLAFEMVLDTPSPRRHIKTLEQSTPLICGLLKGSVPSPPPTALAPPLNLLPVTPFPLSPHTLEGLPPPLANGSAGGPALGSLGPAEGRAEEGLWGAWPRDRAPGAGDR